MADERKWSRIRMSSRKEVPGFFQINKVPMAEMQTMLVAGTGQKRRGPRPKIRRRQAELITIKGSFSRDPGANLSRSEASNRA